MFEILEKINEKPEPFQFYTARDLWTDEHISEQMLSYHLDQKIDVASRNAEFIDRSLEWITSEFKVGEDFKIADFGCGPGLYTKPLAERGAKITGIDFSWRSLEYARNEAAREHVKINYVEQNYLEFETEDRFDLLLMIMCDFCALSPSQRKKLLRLFNRILKPGGSVLLDVYSLKAFEEKKKVAVYGLNLLKGFWSPNRYYGFLNTFKYDEEKVWLDKYTIIESDRTRTVYNWLQFFSPVDLEKELTEAGLSLKDLYSDVAGTPYTKKSSEFAAIATKNPA